MRVSLIIPAAGLSSRFRKSLLNSAKKAPACGSKLLYHIGGEPVLLRTLRAFSKIAGIQETIVAVSPEMRREVKAWQRAL